MTDTSKIPEQISEEPKMCSHRVREQDYCCNCASGHIFTHEEVKTKETPEEQKCDVCGIYSLERCHSNNLHLQLYTIRKEWQK